MLARGGDGYHILHINTCVQKSKYNMFKLKALWSHVYLVFEKKILEQHRPGTL